MTASDTEESKLRTVWKRRQGGGAVPLVLIANDPDSDEHIWVVGPQLDEPLRRLHPDALYTVIREVADLNRLEGIRCLASRLAQESTCRLRSLWRSALNHVRASRSTITGTARPHA